MWLRFGARGISQAFTRVSKSDAGRDCDIFSGQPGSVLLPTWTFAKVGPVSSAFLTYSRSACLSLRRNHGSEAWAKSILFCPFVYCPFTLNTPPHTHTQDKLKSMLAHMMRVYSINTLSLEGRIRGVGWEVLAGWGVWRGSRYMDEPSGDMPTELWREPRG